MMYKIAPVHQRRGFSQPGPAVTSHSIANSLRLPSAFSYHHSLLAHTPAPAAFERNLAGDGPSIISCRGDDLIGDVHKKIRHKGQRAKFCTNENFCMRSGARVL